jgi:hypothetical protein
VHKAVDSLGGDIKMQIAPQRDRFPCRGAVRIGVLKKKVRGKARVCRIAFRMELVRPFVPAAPEYFQGQQIGSRQGKAGRIAPELAIHAVDIAILAAGADFAASMPWIPRIP